MYFTVLFAAAMMLLSSSRAHIPHLDDGTHTSITTAWPFPDLTITRVLMSTFDCPSVATYSKVSITNASTPLVVGVGIPNASTIYDYRPSLWALGKTLVTPQDYQSDSSFNILGGNSEPSQASLRPRVPRGFNAVEFPTEGSGIFRGFAEEGGEVSGYGLLAVNITVSAPGDVYLVLQPTENRRAKAYIALGTQEEHDPEPGSASEADTNGWFSATSTPRLGDICLQWYS